MMNNQQTILRTVLTAISNYSNPSLREIHDKLLDYIRRCKSFSDFKPLTKDKIKLNQNMLGKISNETEFINFCKNESFGIYYKCCAWAKNLNIKELPNTEFFFIQLHHIECKYMLNYPISETYQNLINKQFNLVALPKSMHIFMHFVRWIEYSYQQDYVFLSYQVFDLRKIEDKSVVNQFSETEKQENIINLGNLLVKLFENNPDLFMKYEDAKEMQRLNSQKGGIANALKVQNPTITNYLNDKMSWTYNKPNAMTTITFLPQEFKIIRQVVIALHEKMETEGLLEESDKDWTSNTSYLDDQTTYLINYLLGKGKAAVSDNVTKYYPYLTYYKYWQCEQAFNNQTRIDNVKQNLKYNQQVQPPILNTNVSKSLNKTSSISKTDKQSDQLKDILRNKTMIWTNEYWFLHEDEGLKSKTRELIIKPGQFDNLTLFVQHLMDLLPPILKDQYINYNYYTTNNEARKIIKRSFANILNGKTFSSNKKPLNNSAYNWYCNKIF